jgi:alkanesulfonate monooxygenase SsuD/methylene tetrahydromethanopterin reductase-like flavin-dependent oxidoreductase (luciferase family)
VATSGLPIGICLRTIRTDPAWWLESARRLDAAGYAGVWAWDHFMGIGQTPVPVVEGWTILAMAAGATSRLTVGPFVLNVMNRHPAVVARMAATLQVASGGRLILGMGIGALPVPRPAPPILIGGETVAGARLAARIGDGWNTFEDNFEANLPVYLDELGEHGRRREDQLVIVGFQGDWLSDETIADSPWVTEPRETWARWREAGADGAIVLARTTADVDALVSAVDRW